MKAAKTNPTDGSRRPRVIVERSDRIIKVASKISFIIRSTRQAIARRPLTRRSESVIEEYGAAWNSFRQVLASTDSVEAWLNIDGFDRREDWFNVDGALFHGSYNASQFYRSRLKWALDTHFADINSVTEYGAGLGRNLLFLKSLFPHLQCNGYELVGDGVEIARAAAAKFGLDVNYAQLDYLNDPIEKFVFPPSDVAFTVFSLEQLPVGCDIALRNILHRTRFGTIHLEPVPENYPLTPRGLIGRIDHVKAGYLRQFGKAVGRQDLSSEWHERMSTSHNALMFPSLYVLKKQRAASP